MLIWIIVLGIIFGTAVSATASSVTIVDPGLSPTSPLESVAQAWVKVPGKAAQICPATPGFSNGKHDINGGKVECHQSDVAQPTASSAQADAVAQTAGGIITNATASTQKNSSTDVVGAVAYAASGQTYQATAELKGPRASLTYAGLMVSSTTDPIDSAYIVTLSNLEPKMMYMDLFQQCAQYVGSQAVDPVILSKDKNRGSPDKVFARVTVVLRSNGKLQVKAKADSVCDPKDQTKCSASDKFLTKEDFTEDVCKDPNQAKQVKGCGGGNIVKRLKKDQVIVVRLPDLKEGETMKLRLDEVICMGSKKGSGQAR